MPKKNNGEISINDVAKKAKVSTATVSRVLNNSTLVHPETREMVLKVSKKLNFKLSKRRPGPKPNANEMKPVIHFLYFIDSGSTHSESNPTLILIKKGIEKAVKELGFRLIYNIHNYDDELNFDSHDEPVGFVLIGKSPSLANEKFLRQFPCCWVMTGASTADWADRVMPDHREVGRLAVRYLLERGHKHLAHIRLGKFYRIHRFREEGFEYEANKNPDIKWQNINLDDIDKTDKSFSFDSERIECLIKKLQACSPMPTGCFIDGDNSLLQLYPKLIQAGIMPGKDIDIVSCNNIEIYRKLIPFEYTSIDVHFSLIGQMAVNQLYWRINHPDIDTRMRNFVLPVIP